jgi:hypothetical protein
MSRIAYNFMLTGLLTGTLVALPALAQHEGDIGVGRTAAGQLRVRPFTPAGPPCFDPAIHVGHLEFNPATNEWLTDEPGWDANFEAAPEIDYYPLQPGATIRLVAVSDLLPPFYVRYMSQVIRHSGDYITLGSYSLHRHTIFAVDADDPAFDPLRTLWYGTFILRDVGSTGYADSEPFTLRMSIAECEPGDVNEDGLVNSFDIDAFVSVLTDPAAATPGQRCAADADRNGIVNVFDIDAFVELLTGR